MTRKCKKCGEPDAELFFTKRNWRTNRWIICSKWHNVGTGLCVSCAQSEAKRKNGVIDPPEPTQTEETQVG